MSDNTHIFEYMQRERHKQYLREAEHKHLVDLALGPRVSRLERLRCWIAGLRLRLRTRETLHEVPCATA